MKNVMGQAPSIPSIPGPAMTTKNIPVWVWFLGGGALLLALLAGRAIKRDTERLEAEIEHLKSKKGPWPEDE